MSSFFFYIDGVKINYKRTHFFTVLQYCDMIGVELPRFCYHDQLSISGNCRMCVIETSVSVKPVIACATELTEGIYIYTSSFLAITARENVLGFLLISHPLDCPICDQGGECDLQDLSMLFGSDTSSFFYCKRSVSDKVLGFFVKCVMDRCIHCTRCVRFMDELVGVPCLGTIGRGHETELSTFLDFDYVDSVVLGNIIDLCPVGALTSKPYAFSARPWELTSTESIDILDSLCSNIRIDYRGLNIMRILPRLNTLVNEEWITDKIRFCYDGVSNNRLVTPFVRSVTHTFLFSCSWKYAFSFFKRNFFIHFLTSKTNVFFGTGGTIDASSLFLLKWFTNYIGLDAINTAFFCDHDFRFSYLLNDNNLFSDNNVFLFLGLNLSIDSPILNIRLKQRFNLFKHSMRVGYIGNTIVSKPAFVHLGFSSALLYNVYFGKSFFCFDLYKHSFNVVTGGNTCFNSTLIYSLSSFISSCSSVPFSYNHISLFSGTVCANELSAYCSFNSRVDFFKQKCASFFFFLGQTSFLNHIKADLSNFSFVVFQGHHLLHNINDVDLFLPTSVFFESDGLYLNCQGRLQRCSQSVNSPINVYCDDVILLSLFSYLFSGVPSFLSFYARLFNCYLPHKINIVTVSSFFFFFRTDVFYFFTKRCFFSIYRNYYESDILCKASSVLSKLNTLFEQHVSNNYI